jgi:predicted nucleic acid-binding Zn ribbon protein
MAKRQPLAKPVTVRQVLDSLIRPGDWQALEQRRRLREIWEEVVPEPVQAQARLVDFSRRELWVEVTASPWVQELQYLKPKILDSFAMALGAGVVRDVRFRVGGGKGED